MSSIIQKENYQNKNISKVIKSIGILGNSIIEEAKGLFGQIVTVNINSILLDNSKNDIEFTVPFDNDIEPNEAEITVYNLNDRTIADLAYNQKVSITAGYKDDTGIIFSGHISKVKTKHENVDKITTIYVLDDQSLTDKEIQEISYAENINSSYILKDLLNKTNLPIAVFQTRYDYVNKEAAKIDGSLTENIKKYAKQCGIDVYINKGKIYAHDIRSAGTDINFIINSNTGMIGSPEEFTEEIEEENYKEIVKGYNIEMLLQHRIQTGIKVKLDSKYANGIFTVKSGEHSYDGNNLITKINVIA